MKANVKNINVSIITAETTRGTISANHIYDTLHVSIAIRASNSSDTIHASMEFTESIITKVHHTYSSVIHLK